MKISERVPPFWNNSLFCEPLLFYEKKISLSETENQEKEGVQKCEHTMIMYLIYSMHLMYLIYTMYLMYLIFTRTRIYKDDFEESVT